MVGKEKVPFEKRGKYVCSDTVKYRLFSYFGVNVKYVDLSESNVCSGSGSFTRTRIRTLPFPISGALIGKQN